LAVQRASTAGLSRTRSRANRLRRCCSPTINRLGDEQQDDVEALGFWRARRCGCQRRSGEKAALMSLPETFRVTDLADLWRPQLERRRSTTNAARPAERTGCRRIAGLRRSSP
jgi:hypothetical protein